ncbi:MAG: hypothetical protein ACT4QA_20580 [Panacagrimonas sp.]
MHNLSIAVCAALTLCLSACDVSVEGGLTGSLVETVRADVPPKNPLDATFGDSVCFPDDSLSNPALVLETPRTNLSFCEFEEPLGVDRFELTGLVEGQRYQVSTFDLGPVGDTLIEIFDASSRSIAFNDDRNDFDRSSSVIFEAVADVVTVEVRSNSGNVGPSHRYNLLASAEVIEPPPPCSADPSEDNDTETTARSLGSGTGRDGLALSFCEDPVDYFLLDVVPGELRRLSTFGLGVNADTLLEVFGGRSEAAGRIAFSDDVTRRGLASTVEFQVPDGIRSILIKVSSAGFAFGDGRDYVLTTQATPVQASGSDRFEPNDTDTAGSGGPKALGTGTPTEGISLNFDDDPVDYFLLDVTPGTAYLVRSFGLECRANIVVEAYAGPSEANGLILSSVGFNPGDCDGNTPFDDVFINFIAPDAVTTVLVKVKQADPAVTGDGTGYRLTAAAVTADLVIDPFFSALASASLSLLEGGGSLPLSPRLVLASVPLINRSPNEVSGQLALFLSTDPVIDPTDLRIPLLNFLDPSIPPTDSVPFGLLPYTAAPLFPVLDLRNASSGIFYLGASIESDTLVDEASESNNRQLVLPPLKLSGEDGGDCLDDFGDTEFRVGSGGPGSGGDDRPAVAPFVAVGSAGTQFGDRFGTQFFNTGTHCVDAEDWVQTFVPAGQTALISTTGLGTEADTVLGLYRDRGDSLIFESDDLPPGAGPALGSFLRFTAGQDEILFVRVSSKNGAGSNRRYLLNLAGEAADPLPDLVGNLVSAPASAAPGEPFEVTVEIRNLGRGAAAASAARVGLACFKGFPTIPLGEAIPVPALGPESVSSLLTQQITIDPASLPIGFDVVPCNLFVSADSAGAVAESVDDVRPSLLPLLLGERDFNSAGDRAFLITPVSGPAPAPVSRNAAASAASAHGQPRVDSRDQTAAPPAAGNTSLRRAPKTKPMPAPMKKGDLQVGNREHEP